MDIKEHERLLSRAADAKLIHMNEQVLFPILHKKIEQNLADLCEHFKGKNEVKMSTVAYIAACRDIIMEINSIARHGDKAAVDLDLNKLD